MENKQQQLMAPAQEQFTTKEDVYTWSMMRVAEGMAINVGSAILIAIITAMVAFFPSILLLLSQRVFHFLVIPTNWLEIAAFFGGAVLFVLFVFVGLLYLYMRKHPTLFLGMLLGAFIGFLAENKVFKFDNFTFPLQERKDT